MSGIQGERFDWNELRPEDEPGRHRWFWVGVTCSLLLGTPWWARWVPSDSRVAGLPTWVVLVLAAAVMLSTTVALSALFLWRDREPGPTPVAETETEAP